jgi:hypothetical protein
LTQTKDKAKITKRRFLLIDDIPFIFNWIQILLEILDTLCKSIVMNFKDFDGFAQVHFQEGNQKAVSAFSYSFLVSTPKHSYDES